MAIWNGLDEEMTLKAVALGKIKSVFLQIRIEWLVVCIRGGGWMMRSKIAACQAQIEGHIFILSS